MTIAPPSAPAVPRWRPGQVPIRVGLVGLGHVGLGHHVPALLALPGLVRVVAVADPSPERRALTARALGLDVGSVYARPEALLGRDDIDVVDLATPPHVRTPLAIEALGQGKAILCEKPIALTPADGMAIGAAAAASGAPAAIIHNWLALPEIVAACDAIAAGTIGRPEIAILNLLGVEDRPGSTGWQPNWRHDPAIAGGGVLMDMLHVVYVAEALLGRPFRRVSAEVLSRTAGAPVEDIALCRFEADDGIALVNVGWGVGPGGIAVSGPDGRIEIGFEGGGTGPFARLQSVRLTRSDGRVEDRTPPLPPADGSIDVRVKETFRAFFERLAAGQPPAATALDGVRALEATLGAYASAATGRTIDLPLPPEDPVHRRGLAGLAELPLAPGGAIARQGIFGIRSGR
ncbi:MAG: Gfo/Idh/MocA family oxidoreductase [Chloroflexota bacterium]|nr:Gfo/Idh/MocA family oxidoreductase [Chloroflexota bacterium]